MAIIWRNEYRRGDAANPGITPDPPPGAVEITKVEQAGDGNWHIWFAPVPARPADPSDEAHGADRCAICGVVLRSHDGRDHPWAGEEPLSDEDRIRGAMAGAQEHPGRTITR